MYSLLMAGSEGYWIEDDGPVDWPEGRFLEHTLAPIRSRFASLSDEAIAELKAAPVLFAYELPTEGLARVGTITRISRRQSGLQFEYEFHPGFRPLTQSDLQPLLGDLDIEPKMEVRRTHWAVKEVDLHQILENAGFGIRQPAFVAGEVSVSRRAVILATELLGAALGHTEFDSMLLEAGIDEIDAGRSKGGLKARGIALGQYAVRNPDQETAEGVRLDVFVLSRALEVDRTRPDGSIQGFDDEKRADLRQEAMKGGLPSGRGAPSANPKPSKPVPPASDTAATHSKLPALSGRAPGAKPRVFIVHGRDDGMKEQVARWVERIGLEAVILHEQPNKGRTLIAKFREEAHASDYALVLMSPDDEGRLKGATAMEDRARQNVILELGFFVGAMAAEKVCVLRKGSVVGPSDLDGVAYVNFDPGNGWKNDLARELRAAGISFDASRAF